MESLGVPHPIESLRTMPLHTISEVYGEQGLRERFDLELDRFNEEDRERIADARDLALALHAKDRRTREPYNNHILRVATRIISADHYDVDDPDIVIAALLHDSVEDHEAELAAMYPGDAVGDERTIAFLFIAQRYGLGVRTIVEAVTNPKFDKTGDWQEAYRRHVEEMLLKVPKARPVKLSDFTDNGTGIMYSLPDKIHKLAPKYAPMPDMFRRIVRLPDTPLSEEVKEKILQQLDLTDERLSPFLD